MIENAFVRQLTVLQCSETVFARSGMTEVTRHWGKVKKFLGSLQNGQTLFRTVLSCLYDEAKKNQ